MDHEQWRRTAVGVAFLALACTATWVSAHWRDAPLVWPRTIIVTRASLSDMKWRGEPVYLLETRDERLAVAVTDFRTQPQPGDAFTLKSASVASPAPSGPGEPPVFRRMLVVCRQAAAKGVGAEKCYGVKFLQAVPAGPQLPGDGWAAP